MSFIVLTFCACWPLLLLACLLEFRLRISLLTLAEKLDLSYVRCAVAGLRATAIGGKVVGRLVFFMGSCRLREPAFEGGVLESGHTTPHSTMDT